ncbi:PDZ domain-containing protein [Tissierella carlieri]|uniref:PDZ domain-containing protein n=1 Tax=Tissierella carlieri TaxID=689904 RepID=A0ABT1SAK4_9FIRM|nr:PDZ domain-containing protein [Tissierella carlieri]MBU5313922.1 PDZ domain-containing protein [Tissierella carlieri]MCQ4923514.1 PDZ domain-containing protein [Tissierella carlieri]
MYGLYQIVYFTIIDIINTLKSPFFIAVLCIIYFQYLKIGKIEKENLGYKRSALLKLFISTIFGMFGGIITTVVFLYLGVVVIPKDFMYILIVAIILSLINPRYMCFSYGGSIVALCSLIIGYPKIQISQVMSVVAVLHIVESILILLDGWRSRLPVFFETKSEIVGGFNMNRFWPIPFVIFIGDGLIHPITLMAILSYGDYSISSYPRQKVVKTSVVLFLYSIILLYLSKTIENPFIPPLFALLGHEYIILQNKMIENNKIPIFTSFDKGVKVLEVLPNTVAHKLGIKTGDIVLKINGAEINSNKDLEDLMNIKINKLRIEFFNMKSGLSIKRYYGKRKSLGLIIVPRDF